MKKQILLLIAGLIAISSTQAMHHDPKNIIPAKYYSEVASTASHAGSSVVNAPTAPASNTIAIPMITPQTDADQLIIITTRFDESGDIGWFINQGLKLSRNAHLKDQGDQEKIAFHRLPLDLEETYKDYAITYNYHGAPCSCWLGYITVAGKTRLGIFESTYNSATGVYHRSFNSNGLKKYPIADKIRKAISDAQKIRDLKARALRRLISKKRVTCQINHPEVSAVYEVTRYPTTIIYREGNTSYGIITGHCLINDSGTFVDNTNGDTFFNAGYELSTGEKKMFYADGSECREEDINN